MGRSETPTVDVELRVAHARLEAVVASLKTMLEDVRIERDALAGAGRKAGADSPATDTGAVDCASSAQRAHALVVAVAQISLMDPTPPPVEQASSKRPSRARQDAA